MHLNIVVINIYIDKTFFIIFYKNNFYINYFNKKVEILHSLINKNKDDEYAFSVLF